MLIDYGSNAKHNKCKLLAISNWLKPKFESFWDQGLARLVSSMQQAAYSAVLTAPLFFILQS